MSEIGEKDGIDELGLAAREFRDECDGELVLVQALEQLPELEVGLGVGELLAGQPVAQARDSRRQAATPVTIGFEPGREIARWNHADNVIRAEALAMRWAWTLLPS